MSMYPLASAREVSGFKLVPGIITVVFAIFRMETEKNVLCILVSSGAFKANISRLFYYPASLH